MVFIQFDQRKRCNLDWTVVLERTLVQVFLIVQRLVLGLLIIANIDFNVDFFLWKTINGVPCTKSTLPITFFPSSSDLVIGCAQKEATWLMGALIYVSSYTACFSRLPALHFGSFLRYCFCSCANTKSFLCDCWSSSWSCFSGDWAGRQRQLKSSLQPWMAKPSIASFCKERKSGSSAIDKRLSSASLLDERKLASASPIFSVLSEERALVL